MGLSQTTPPTQEPVPRPRRLCYGSGVRIATWNVNSVKAREARLLEWLARHEHDVVCLQELNLETEKFPAAAVRALG